MHPGVTVTKHRRLPGIGRGDNNGAAFFAPKISEMEPGAIVATGQQETRAGYRGTDSGAQAGGVGDFYIRRLSQPRQHDGNRYPECLAIRRHNRYRNDAKPKRQDSMRTGTSLKPGAWIWNFLPDA